MKKITLNCALALLSFTTAYSENLLNDPDLTLSTDPAGWFGWNGASIDPVSQILTVDGTVGTFTPLSAVETILNDGFASWTSNQLTAGTYTFSVEVTDVTSDGTVVIFGSWQDDTWTPAGAGREETSITEPGIYEVSFTVNETTSYFTQVGFAIEGWTSGSVSFKNPSLTLNSSSEWAGYPVGPELYADTGSWMGWVYVGKEPWIYSLGFNKYIYISEAGVTQAGGWAYVPK